MKIRRTFEIFLAVLIIFSLMGCQLALEDKEDNTDILIGVFITEERLDLFDMEGYLNDNINTLSGGGLINIDKNSSQYQGRLYATLTTRALKDDTGKNFDTREFVFNDFKGISYFSARVPATENEDSYITSGSEAVSDGYTSFHFGEDEDKTTLEGTIYISSDYAGKTLFINPVYQSSDGTVYAITGNGIMVSDEQGEGSVYTQTLEETTTITENGKRKSKSTSIKISLAVMFPPEQIFILQMDKDSEIIAKTKYAPGKLPGTIIPEAGVEYIIVESNKIDIEGNTVTSRTLFDRSNETLESFYRRSDGICVKQSTILDWNGN